jgi:uncharacterized protein YjbI with pentapeptide repeats
MLLVIAWQIILEIYNLGWGNRLLGKAYREKWASEIEAGEMPESLRKHLIDVLYQHRFGLFLLAPVILIGIFLILLVPYVLTQISVDHSSNAGGTIAVAVVGLPVFAFVWFIRAYERDRELTREESDLWSNQFNELMKAASDYDDKNKVLQRTAIRQLQDYLSGAKWKTNRRSNNTAIFELFSSIVGNEKMKFHLNAPSGKGVISAADTNAERLRMSAIADAKKHPLILSVSAVLKAVFSKRNNAGCRVHVSQNSLEHMSFDFLTLDKVNFSGLKISNSSFDKASMWDMSLVGTDFTLSSFVGAELFLSDLTDASLAWANLTDADLENVILRNAKMRNSDLTNASMVESNLIGADLTGANLNGASLINADLSGAFCRGIKLGGADLSGANLSRTGLSKNAVIGQHKDVKYDDKTLWDEPA